MANRKFKKAFHGLVGTSLRLAYGGDPVPNFPSYRRAAWAHRCLLMSNRLPDILVLPLNVIRGLYEMASHARGCGGHLSGLNAAGLRRPARM